MRVGEVDPGPRDPHEHRAVAGVGDGGVLDQLEDLGPAPLADPDRPHGAAGYYPLGAPHPSGRPTAHMTVTVVGSIAFDAVETPAGKRDRLLGGAAVHFALASSFLAETRVVGPVGDDFGEDEYAVLRARGVVTDDIEHVPGGKTFFWAGRYAHDVNERETLRTDLNVFEHFEPKLSDASKAADTLFLANIQPDLQRAVREQCPGARFTAMDSMNLWIDIARDSLVRDDRHGRLRAVQRLRAQDAHRRAEPGAGGPGGARARPADRRGQAGRVRRRRCSRRTATSGCRPIRRPTSWTRPAPGTPSRAASWATSPRTPPRRLAGGLLRRAMAYGTALASFNVEAFGTERMQTLTPAEIADRVAELERSTRFDPAPVALRG